jgi:hypothetical protein
MTGLGEGRDEEPPHPAEGQLDDGDEATDDFQQDIVRGAVLEVAQRVTDFMGYDSEAASRSVTYNPPTTSVVITSVATVPEDP